MKRVLALSVAALLVVLATSRIVKAFNPQPDPPALFGMIGVTSSQTLRLNVVNVQVSGAPPDPCKVSLRFLNSSGNILKQEVFTIKTGQAVGLGITGAEAGTTFRAEVHPVLALTTKEPTGCSAVGSVEVYDTASGVTSIFAHPIYVSLPAVQ